MCDANLELTAGDVHIVKFKNKIRIRHIRQAGPRKRSGQIQIEAE